jgi:hypothetical protein
LQKCEKDGAPKSTKFWRGQLLLCPIEKVCGVLWCGENGEMCVMIPTSSVRLCVVYGGLTQNKEGRLAGIGKNLLEDSSKSEAF